MEMKHTNKCAFFNKKYLQFNNLYDNISIDLVELVKWLTRQIVALVCKGSIPLYRPIMSSSEAEFQFHFFLYFKKIFRSSVCIMFMSL